MPSAYEGTDIISCLHSKYIIRQCRISYRTSDISFEIVKRQVIVKMLGKGPVGHYELLGLVSNVAKRLQQEAFIEKKFGRKLPIIIHGLEYAWFDIEATQNANINGEADIFLKAMKELGMC